MIANMIKARKKMVTLAVASAIGGGMLASAPAHALNVSQDEVGQVLLFPYYTVKNGYDTLFSIVNTSNKTVVAKIRWREALNSREVRDFNIILSPHDVWNGAVTATAAGGALVRTFDKTCTAPQLPASAVFTTATEVAFTSIGYDGSDASFNYDNGGTAIGRTQEGYFEVIQMASSTIVESSIASGNKVEYNSQHVSGVPRNCTTVAAVFDVGANLVNPPTAGNAFSTFTNPQNVLMASASLINVANGSAVDVHPTHLENWLTAGTPTYTALFAPGDLLPDLTNGDDSGVNTLVATEFRDGATIVHGALPPQDAVTALLQATSVINEYATSGTSVMTDWVVTMPTKQFYVDSVPGPIPVAALPPFANPFDAKSCDTYSLTFYNREEKTSTASAGSFSPAPTGSTASLCYEANVLTFNGGYALGTGVNHVSVDTTAVGTSGWANLAFVATVANTGQPSALSNGLPVIGFAMTSRVATADGTGINKNYGTSRAHGKQHN